MKFFKLQATGNDFIVVDARNEYHNWPRLSQLMCRYHFGIGADGVILVQNSPSADLKMSIFNSDGSKAEVCGNGLRCLAKYAIEHQVVDTTNISVETLSGVKRVKAHLSGQQVTSVEVEMGLPVFTAEDIPVDIKTGKVPLLEYPLDVEKGELTISVVSMGNPHAVHFLSGEIATFPLDKVGPQVERHVVFPQRTNFEIAKVISRKRIKARVWERGVGETLACGSGACAIVVAARILGYIDDVVDIILPGGTLTIRWDGQGSVSLTGPVGDVFTGEWPSLE